MTLITAIVPTFNRSGYLKQAIEALRNQTRRLDEIIVWDDGSTDDTPSVAREFGDDIRYFRSANGGKSRALNQALREARGDLIWICDDDDLALPDAAETLLSLLEAHPEAGIAGGSYRRFRDADAGGRDEQGPGYWPDLTCGAPIRHLLEDIFLFQNAMLVRREVYDRAGPFAEHLARSIDYEMLVRIGLLAPIVLTEQPLFLQRKHDGDRGPAAARHVAARSDAVWKSADRDIFKAMRSVIPIDFYRALFSAETPELAQRAALLQRGCVYARRTDWQAALADFNAAAALVPGAPLAPVEQKICRRAMGGKHGIDEALARDTRRALVALAQGSGAGASIARALARGLLWRARAAVTARHVGQSVAIMQLITALMTAGSVPRGEVPQTEECRDISVAAFLKVWPPVTSRPVTSRQAP